MHRKDTKPRIWRSKIHNCGGTAIYFFDTAKGVIEDCDVYSSKEPNEVSNMYEVSNMLYSSKEPQVKNLTSPVCGLARGVSLNESISHTTLTKRRVAQGRMPLTRSNAEMWPFLLALNWQC